MGIKTNDNQLPATENNTNVDIYSTDFVESSEKHIKAIEKELSNSEKGFVKIAIALKWLKDNQAYRTYGCKNITELAQLKFGFKSTKTYDYINIIERFGNGDNNTVATDLKKEFKAYTPSKLVNLLSLTNDEILLNTNADMSVRDIKEAVKAVIKNNTSVDSSVMDSVKEFDKQKKCEQGFKTDTSEPSEQKKETYKIKEWVNDVLYDFMESHSIKEFDENMLDLKAHLSNALDIYKKKNINARIVVNLQYEIEKELFI